MGMRMGMGLKPRPRLRPGLGPKLTRLLAVSIVIAIVLEAGSKAALGFATAAAPKSNFKLNFSLFFIFIWGVGEQRKTGAAFGDSKELGWLPGGLGGARLEGPRAEWPFIDQVASATTRKAKREAPEAAATELQT